MNYKKLGLFLLVAVLATNLLGCENQFFQKSKSITKETAKVKANKENLQTVENQKKIEMLRKNEAILQKKIRDYLVANSYSGSFFVEQNNQILFKEGVGYANVEKKVLNEPSTTYPIGSITKIFVATSIMKLQEQHKLNIQDPVSKYIPNFPDGNNIKLYNFLTHTSGIAKPHWSKGDTTPRSLLKDIEKMPLKFKPGEKWDYQDVNYIVLGNIVEKVTGKPLHDFIRKNILDKVPLEETGFITHEDPVPYTSVGYFTKNQKVQETKYLSTNSLYACGDIYETASDLSKFDQALMDGKLVSKDTLHQMLTSSAKSTYGLGLYNNGNAVYSIGVLGGWITMHSYYNDKTSIVVFLNAREKATTHIDTISSDIFQMVKDTFNPVGTSPKS